MREYELRAAPSMRLSKRQSQVLLALASGLSHKGIGVLLGISHNTVDVHMQSVRLALGANSSEQAIAIALRTHLIL